MLGYLPDKVGDTDFSNTIYPEGIEKAPLKYAIIKRNKWMIDNSDFVITYVKRVVGGAAQFKELAQKKKKIIIEI